MRLPYEKFILASIVKGEKLDGFFEDLRTLPPKKEYTEHLENAIKGSNLPKPVIGHIFKPRKIPPKNFSRYISSMKVGEAYRDEASYKVSLEMFCDLGIRGTLLPLIILKTSPEEISALVNGKFGTSYRASHTDLFKKYFFETAIMKRSDWNYFLSGLDGKEKENVLRALHNKETEVRADLGLPNKVSVSENYQMMHIIATDKFRQLMESKDPGADAQALKWAQLAMSSGDKYEKLKVGDIGDFSKDLQIEFDFIDDEFPTIGEGDD